MSYLNPETCEFMSMLKNNYRTIWQSYLLLAKKYADPEQLAEKIWKDIEKNNPLKNDDSIYSNFLCLSLRQIETYEVALRLLYLTK